MLNKYAIIIILVVTYLALSCIHLEYKLHKAELAASIYSDCCRNMYDNYGDPDSLYNYYTNIAIREGIDIKSFESYYFCY